ncbi:MAG: lasso RiPP family leader peptide-containing protein [Sciscionella sp.]
MPTDEFLRPSADDQPEFYEPPELVEVGNVIELTHGSSFDDTADKKRWYY